jgi:hypothetical protein
MGHANFHIEVPGGIASPADFHSMSKIRFWDGKDPAAWEFECIVNLTGIERFIQKFQSVVHSTMAKKYAVSAPP